MREKQLERLLAVRQQRFQALLVLTKAVNSNFSKAALLKLFEYNLEGALQIGKIALFVWEEEWRLLINNNNQTITNKIKPQEDLLKFQVIQKVTNFPGGIFEGFDFLIPVVHNNTPIAYLLIGEIETEKIDSIDDKLKFIETISNLVLISLENKRMFNEQLKQERVNKEIELAAQVQNMLIPQSLPKNDTMEVAGYYRPHGSIGGDYYDFIEIDDTHVAFCMCDVSGKGIGAGMIMANFQANLRALANKDYPLEQLIDHLNFKLKETTKGEKFITMFFGIFNTASRKLQYVNAGHNPPLLVSGGDVKLLKDGCTILGVFDSLPFIQPQELILDQNAQLIMYTDGLSELENELGEMFDEDKLTAYALAHQDLPITDFVETLVTSLEKYKGEMDYNDDVSILTCRFF
ncbi:MAG: PP2C family protein-serine/threonine phosphatase [Chitinophagales bacterium]